MSHFAVTGGLHVLVGADWVLRCSHTRLSFDDRSHDANASRVRPCMIESGVKKLSAADIGHLEEIVFDYGL